MTFFCAQLLSLLLFFRRSWILNTKLMEKNKFLNLNLRSDLADGKAIVSGGLLMKVVFIIVGCWFGRTKRTKWYQETSQKASPVFISISIPHSNPSIYTPKQGTIINPDWHFLDEKWMTKKNSLILAIKANLQICVVVTERQG